ncbi:MAG: hypothetical protein E5W64_01430 [Mesorhizobium sp.]|uniref:hypothetical protein n=2 Tax=Phyllobacteriaceae TaxID=69277 RepID=UPI0009EF5582|nr:MULTISPECIES: hypothetical protein [Mesorhizobium]RUU08417.1 hypothetical protein EOD10_28540 [Mesorhizobium sp. M7A.T.Ca.TU.009.01.3.2]RUV13207.1 hypothetical protein EOD00_05030 [Mesorhizobium sp. M7A.T.Ca.TU.009.01.3.1]RUX06621.1 hypothetical protein EOA35_04905 [Mesorhizobium sp. M8A.F.Ca.ET.023.01.1.1]RUZ86462.1 hypothetical protein EN947_11395 [Mesorhizobium sp. M7A.F.Ca.US.003.02.2.1]RVA41696.1 hypothetical protein EN933_26415 [Mesorhizobium sp. M7A.F.Ca.US.001.01.1.1]RVB43140.1 hyp
MLKNIMSAPLGLLFMLGGPITYVMNVVDTWQGHASVVVKILINLSLDAMLAFIWPITWAIWLFKYMAGAETPLTTVLGV